MKILYGKPVVEERYTRLQTKINTLATHNIIPTLAVILIGHRRDSQTYVKMKQQRCDQLGIQSLVITLPENVSENVCIEHVQRLNHDETVHGILIQLPLPSHINEDRVLQRVKVCKDVDGFTTENISKLVLHTNPVFCPCTPEGCLQLLHHYNYELQGKHAVVIGRSRIVGVPLAHLLLNHNATITICHSKTTNIEQITQKADFLFVACGKPLFVKKEMVKKGAVIIDIGINAIEDSSKKRGYSLVGDVDRCDVAEVASAITPVPKGVGPLTICMLMEHTVKAAEMNGRKR